MTDVSKIESYEIRRIESEDYDRGVLELLSQLTVCDKKAISKEQFCEQIDFMSRHNIYMVVNVVNDKIVGVGSVFIEPKLIHNISFVGHIEDVVVHEEWRGQNIGKQLIHHLTRFAEGKGCYKVILDCAENNVKFYEKCGFKRNGIEMRINIL